MMCHFKEYAELTWSSSHAGVVWLLLPGLFTCQTASCWPLHAGGTCTMLRTSFVDMNAGRHWLFIKLINQIREISLMPWSEHAVTGAQQQDALESGSVEKLLSHQKQGSHPHTIPSSVRQQSFWPFLRCHRQKFSWLSWLCQPSFPAAPDRKWLPGSSVGPPYLIRKPWSLVFLLPSTVALIYADTDGPTTLRGPASLQTVSITATLFLPSCNCRPVIAPRVTKAHSLLWLAPRPVHHSPPSLLQSCASFLYYRSHGLCLNWQLLYFGLIMSVPSLPLCLLSLRQSHPGWLHAPGLHCALGGKDYNATMTPL